MVRLFICPEVGDTLNTLIRSPKDLFSKQADLYAVYRPQYPVELFEHLAKLCLVHAAAWDCATGNGQAARPLTKYFDRVYATDVSEKQLAQAEPDAKIEFSKGSAEQSGLAPHSVDLITVAQAFHWFHFSEFFAEVQRVGKPGAILAVWTYDLPKQNEKIDEILKHFYSDVVGPYWEPERKWVEQAYMPLIVPFTELTAPQLQMTTRWSLDHLLGYMDTWSATQKWKAQAAENSVESLRPAFELVWGSAFELEFQWPLTLRIFQLPP